MVQSSTVLVAVPIVVVGSLILLGSQSQRPVGVSVPAPPTPLPVYTRSHDKPDSDTCCARALLPHFVLRGTYPGQPGTPPPSQLGDEHNGMFTTLSATKPHLCITHADPKYDSDLSTLVAQRGYTEANLLLLYRKVLKPCCADGKGVVVDVGGNFGLHALYSAAMGCKVHTFEPMEEFYKSLKTGRDLNCLTDLVHIHRVVVSNETQTMHMHKVAQRTKAVLGLTSLAGYGLLRGGETVSVRGDTLDNLVLPLMQPHERVCLLKADVEGHEPEVMAGAKQFMKQHTPNAVVLEFSPGMRPQRKADPKMAEMLTDVARHGYSGYSCDWDVAHIAPQDWDESPVLATPIVPNEGSTDNFSHFTDSIEVNIPTFFLRPDINSTVPLKRVPHNK